MDLEQYRFKTTPFEHQRIGWKMNSRSKFFGILADMGTGKTKITLDTVGFMYDNGWVNALMVFGNNGSYMNWKEAIEEHLPDHIPYSLGIWSSKNTKKQQDAMTAAITTTDMKLKIFLMNIEALAFPRGFDAAYSFVKRNYTFSVVDESTTIANPKASRTKAAWKIRDVSAARRILTGSSTDNRPLDAWAQFEFLAKGCLGHTSYYSFRAQYAELAEMSIQRGGSLKSFKVVKGYKNLENLKAAISKISFIVKKEDCLDLPKQTDMFYDVELTDEQRRIYEALRLKSIAELEGKTPVNQQDMTEAEQILKAMCGIETDDSPLVTVKLAITKMLRLHQLVCGHVKDDTGNIHEIENKRLDALADILDETSGRVVIWTSFTYDVERIARFLKKKYGEQSTLTYHGATSNEERAKVKEVFKRGREVPSIQYLVANDKTGGYGNNFTAITTAIYYSYDFDNNVHHQTRDRIHRIGQAEPVTYMYMRAKGTIDEKILSVLQGKQKIADMLITSNWKDAFK